VNAVGAQHVDPDVVHHHDEYVAGLGRRRIAATTASTGGDKERAAECERAHSTREEQRKSPSHDPAS
jgi:hypothetical protein